MELKFKGAFKRDLAKKSKSLISEVYDAVINVKNAGSISQIQNLKKLHGYSDMYRIRVGNYRIGVIIKGKSVWFSRFGHRHIFYRKLFP